MSAPTVPASPIARALRWTLLVVEPGGRRSSYAISAAGEHAALEAAYDVLHDRGVDPRATIMLRLGVAN